MNNHHPVRKAIDESLSRVRFDAEDMHSVLRAVREDRQTSIRPSAPRRVMRFDVSLAASILLILVIPAGLFALRARSKEITSIVSTSGAPVGAAKMAADPHADPIISAPPSYTDPESAAIRLARTCFESTCDASVFSFEEYTLSISASSGEYTVTMESIYDNGCRFVVIVSPEEGRVLRHSTPRLATMPTYLNSESSEIRAWYALHGAYLFTWPLDAQVEFSRRYEGAALRSPHAGELTPEEAVKMACTYARSTYALAPDALPYAYPMLYAERGGSAASYVVHCFEEPVKDTLPSSGYIVTLNAVSGEAIAISAY